MGVRASVDVKLDSLSAFQEFVDELSAALSQLGMQFEPGPSRGRITEGSVEVGRVSPCRRRRPDRQFRQYLVRIGARPFRPSSIRPHCWQSIVKELVPVLALLQISAKAFRPTSEGALMSRRLRMVLNRLASLH